ncbi:conserved repeat domain-containing protein/fimbrial isopeptide formation D2 domain-containing protein [Okibacterium fritillariae]|uniref:Conserved repeat domain-containing protein/fimbrial isopeptide formation D2 domain-containing protein n=2 Tax=Okibacterium fritillariae TaxID=123320 RepID=A0A1T5IBR0_9MICO|nr:conserved repeat domain-containing protein/fimbrial isopeptide formation D2 domain-containing protein [Okibacterium fritillariae]
MHATRPPTAGGNTGTVKKSTAAAVLFALLMGMITVLNVFIPTQTALAAPICAPGNIYVNTGSATPVLNQYSDAGALESSVPVPHSYTDIAFSSNGLTLYGILPGVPFLYTIDPNTGAETAQIAITGLPASNYFVNALSSLADGSLLVGASPGGGATAQQIFRINPASGVATLYEAAFPTGFGSAGDFLSLADGDILAVGAGSNGNALFRISPSFAVTQVGTVPESFGAAQSGGKVFLAGSTGTIYEITSIPTAASTAPVATTAIATTGLTLFGATSQQDSGLCSELTIAKSSDPTSGTLVALGQTVTYSITLANANGTAPAQVDLTDDLSSVLDDATVTSAPAVSSGTALTIDPVANNGFRISGIIPVGGQTTITYAVTINDPATGDRQLSNYVIPTGTTPPTSCDPDNLACTTNPISDPALTIAKTVAPADQTSYEVGEELTYSFLVTNTGNVTLTDVVVNEGDFNGSGELGAVTPASVATLAPGASTTFTATYTLTQADVDRGNTANTATATGVPPTGPPIESPPSTVEVPSVPAPALTIAKTVAPADQTSYEVGEELTYSFLVTNTGNVTLTDVVVNEGDFNGSGELGAVTPASVATLAPGASTTFTATYTLTQADVDRGNTANTATATGVPPTGPPIESPPSTVEVPSVSAPAITVVKTADIAAQEDYVVGQVVTYSFLVTNTGNVSLTDITVNEGEFSGAGELSEVTCPAEPAALAPGEQITCTATYTVVQADVDAGTITNNATVTGTPPNGGTPPTSPPSEVTVPSPPAPGIAVVKTANVEKATAVGQLITYSFQVTNTGNVTLSNVAVDEGKFTGAGSLSAIICPAEAASLAPGQQITCTATYKVTQADLTAGSISNTATATGVPPTGPPIESSPSTVKVSTVKVSTPGLGLASTGANVLPLGIGAIILLFVGAGLVVIRRTRRGAA